MLDSLRFVIGAVAKKDFVPSLTHFRISDGMVRGFNGTVGLSCPIGINLSVSPKATPFVKAIQTCKETIQLHVTPAGKLAVKSGAFKAFVECTPDSSIAVEPEGENVLLNGNLLQVLKRLLPFIAEDASRPWARGILLRGNSAYATNNIVVIENWMETPFPVEINIPKMAIVELLRIGEEPERLQISENSATFHFSGQRWMRTQTYATQWPDLARILDRESSQTPVPAGLWQAIEDLVPFVDDLGRLYLSPGLIATGQTDGTGASVELPDILNPGCFNFAQLRLLQDTIQTMDFTSYPKPCLFFGDRIRGAIVGMHI
jgi:DNA polymerase III sliding clamp (beta) subunit (PCNA family)